MRSNTERGSTVYTVHDNTDNPATVTDAQIADDLSRAGFKVTAQIN